MTEPFEQTGRRATVKDVARVAGVSIGTVSHVLNRSKGVSPAARQAVMAAVAELGYRPNSLARSLIAQRVRPAQKDDPRPGRPRLIAVGYLSIDYMVTVDRVPEPGNRMTSRGIRKMIGGPAANVAAFAAALGAPLDLDVELVTSLGDDADSAWAMEELAGRGIDASGSHLDIGGRLSRCIVLVDRQGQRTIVNEPLQVPVDFVARHVARDRASGGLSCVHFDGFHLPSRVRDIDALRAHGHLLSLHSAGLASDRATPEGCGALLSQFDLLFLDAERFDRIAVAKPGLAARPETVFSLADAPRCQAVLVTRGRLGAMLLRPEKPPAELAAPPVTVTDATGAGDAFAGLYLGSWLAQGDAEVALGHAVRGASLSVTALGAQGRLPSAADVGAAAVTDPIGGV